MIKRWFHGFIALTLLCLLLATFAPAPLLATGNHNVGAVIEQAGNQDNDVPDDQNNTGQSDDQAQTQQGEQNQGNQGQQQGDNQTGCAFGTDQGSATFPSDCWTSLAAGGRHWYQFRYQGLSATDRDDEDDTSSDSSSTNDQPPTVDARLTMDTPGCISFWVMTQRRLQNPDPDDDDIEEPVGAGTPAFIIDNDDDSSSDNRNESVLTWRGSAEANTTFYVIVRNNRDFSCAYSLSLQGAGVPVAGQQIQSNPSQPNQQGSTDQQDMNQQDMNQQDMNQQDMNQQDMNQQGQEQQQSSNQGNQGQQQGDNQTGCAFGTDQGSATFPSDCWTSLAAGGRHWYQFRYQGLSATDSDDEDDTSSDSSSTNDQPPTVDARLTMDTPGCISFWVMTQRRLQNPDPDDDDIEEPVGAGTPAFIIDNDDDSSSDNRNESVLTWRGSAEANTTFYVIVRNNRDFSCAYSLSLQGAGVPVAGQQIQSNPSQPNQDQPGQQGTQGNSNGSDNNGSDNNGSDNNDSNSNDDSDGQG